MYREVSDPSDREIGETSQCDVDMEVAVLAQM